MANKKQELFLDEPPPPHLVGQRFVCAAMKGDARCVPWRKSTWRWSL